MGDGIDLCLVVPPFAQVDRPSLGVGILAAACRDRGLSVRSLYANVLLAKRTGYSVYANVALSGRTYSTGDQLFVGHAYPPGTERDAPQQLDREWQERFDTIAPEVAPFLDEVVERVLALRPRILGISSVFMQNLATSAIALRVKQAAPEIVIVMGGANVSSPMGEALAEVFPWIDHFFSGEADIAFPDFCERLVRDGVRPAERVIHCPPLDDMRLSPAPEFDDYFTELRATQTDGLLPPELPAGLMIETSRGCWWGQKHHCTFCGLNGSTMAFREKPADLVLEELDALTGRWGIKRYMAADNIMPRSFFSELLPRLAERAEPLDFFYEVKANLTDAQLILLKRAGVSQIQPGIESLSSRVLKLMRKGVSGQQNLSLLRGCRALGIEVHWHYLYGFPGEAVEDYASVVDLIPMLEHLEPPGGLSGVLIDRYSPYFDDPASFGMERVAPRKGYDGLYPRDARLSDIAYHFRAKYSTPYAEDAETRRRMAEAIGKWQLLWMLPQPPRLEVAEERTDGVLIRDTRRIARARETLIPHDAMAVLRHFERGLAPDTVPPELAAHVDDLLAAHFLIAHEGKLQSLVVRPLDTEKVAAGEPIPMAVRA